jgi:hypothetical protein
MRLTILLAAAALSFGVAACGSDDESSSSTPTRPDPVAQVDQLSGRATAVTLDGGFVEALQSLKLTPGPLGAASISKAGVASFPITGGSVTYYEPGSVSPYVQGEIDHDGAGLSLEGGGKRVELTDFVVDPGASVLTGKVTVDGPQAAPQVAAESAPLFFLDGRTLSRSTTTAPPCSRARRSSSRPRPQSCSIRRSASKPSRRASSSASPRSPSIRALRQLSDPLRVAGLDLDRAVHELREPRDLVV